VHIYALYCHVPSVGSHPRPQNDAFLPARACACNVTNSPSNSSGHLSFLPSLNRTTSLPVPLLPLQRGAAYRPLSSSFFNSLLPPPTPYIPSPPPTPKQKTYQTMDSLLSANKPTKGSVDDLASCALEFNYTLHHLHLARQAPTSIITTTAAAARTTTGSDSSFSQQQQQEQRRSSLGAKGLQRYNE